MKLNQCELNVYYELINCLYLCFYNNIYKYYIWCLHSLYRDLPEKIICKFKQILVFCYNSLVHHLLTVTLKFHFKIPYSVK